MTLWRLINDTRLDSWPVKHFSLLFDGAVSAGICCLRFVLDPLKFSTVRVEACSKWVMLMDNGTVFVDFSIPFHFCSVD